jgi:hypothetical protein
MSAGGSSVNGEMAVRSLTGAAAVSVVRSGRVCRWGITMTPVIRKGVCEVEGGPPAGVQVVGDHTVAGAVDHLGDSTSDHRAAGDPFDPPRVGCPMPGIRHERNGDGRSDGH